MQAQFFDQHRLSVVRCRDCECPTSQPPKLIDRLSIDFEAAQMPTGDGLLAQVFPHMKMHSWLVTCIKPSASYPYLNFARTIQHKVIPLHCCCAICRSHTTRYPVAKASAANCRRLRSLAHIKSSISPSHCTSPAPLPSAGSIVINASHFRPSCSP